MDSQILSTSLHFFTKCRLVLIELLTRPTDPPAPYWIHIFLQAYKKALLYKQSSLLILCVQCTYTVHIQDDFGEKEWIRDLQEDERGGPRAEQRGAGPAGQRGAAARQLALGGPSPRHSAAGPRRNAAASAHSVAARRSRAREGQTAQAGATVYSVYIYMYYIGTYSL